MWSRAMLRPIRKTEVVVTGFRPPEPLIRRARAEAAKRGISLNRLLCMALEDWLDGKSSKSRR